MPNLEAQLQLETSMRNAGRDRALAGLQRAKDKSRYDDTPPGMAVVHKYTLGLSRTIAADVTEQVSRPGRSKNYAPLLAALDIDAVAYLSISTALTCISKESSVASNTLAMAIGRTLYGELALSGFRDMMPDLYEALVDDRIQKRSKDMRHRITVFRMQAAKNGLSLPEWTTAQRGSVGMYIMYLMMDAGLLDMKQHFTKTASGKPKTVNEVHLGEGAQAILEHVEGRILSTAGEGGPCLIPPADWSLDGLTGGFYGDMRVRAPRFFKGSSNNQEVQEELGTDNTVILGMLNAHQRVAWKVNPYILKVLQDMALMNKQIPGSVEYAAGHHANKPQRPDFLDTGLELTPEQEAEFKDWKASMRDWHTQLKAIQVAEQSVRRLMKQASDWAGKDRLYFVYQADFRGRCYPVSGALNPQGADPNRAMLHAADGEPIDTPEALWWFKLSAAAKYGVDKLAPDACVAWFDDNADNIVRAAGDPLERDAFSWWTEADKPLQFLAVCDEYRRYLEDPDGFLSRITVAMDGTCNGLQNYSAILRDEIGGAATNLKPSVDGVPRDIYSDVAVAAFNRLLDTSPGDIRDAWAREGFNRKLAKKPVMTNVYGSRFLSCQDSVMQYCREKGLFGDNPYEHAQLAAKCIWNGMGDVVVKAAEAMAWLRKVARTACKVPKAQYVSWLSPTGFRVVQTYFKYPDTRIATHVGKSVRIRVKDHEAVPAINKMKHSDGFPPNFIHSVDAAHMAFVTLAMDRFQRGIFMQFVHDEFGVLPKHAGRLSAAIREEFIAMHKAYSLEVIRQEYPDAPPVPACGKLDIDEVRDSVNFFR